MAGFRYCPWCDGSGCIACDAEQKKWTEKALASAPSWRQGDIRDIRDATIEAEQIRAMHGLDSYTEDEVEKAFKPALDAEYARQFPDGPQPAFTARLDNPDDMTLLKKIAHRSVLEKVFSAGVGPEAVEKHARTMDEARLIQAARQVLCPNTDDLKGNP